MSISTIYNSNGQTFSQSHYQGAVYQEVSYTQALTWDKQYTITEPLSESLLGSTISNYPVVPNHYFMGSFDGFWIHRIYNNGNLVMTIQGVNQDMFIPVMHDRIESICMNTTFLPATSDCEPPDIPTPGPAVVLVLAGLIARSRKR